MEILIALTLGCIIGFSLGVFTVWIIERGLEK